MKLLDRFSGPDGKRNIRDALARQVLLSGRQDTIDLLAEQSEVMGFSQGEVLITQDAPDRHILFILAGETTIEVNGVAVNRRSAGTHVGEMAMVDPQAVRSATVRAAVDTVVLKVDESVFSTIADTNNRGYLWKGIAIELAHRLRQRNSSIEPAKRLVLLIHGIRTRAEWQETAKSELQEANVKVIPIKYGLVDALQFWCPLVTRRKPIEETERRVCRAIFDHPGFEVVIIAHSFGTYAISQILKRNPLIRVARLILCGGIVDPMFRWGELPNRPDIVLNDCGCRDIWPVMASCCTWGFGASGAFGYGTHEVEDRFFDHSHGDFFDKDFILKYWKPFVENGFVEGSEHKPKTNTWFKSNLAKMPIQWILVTVAIVLLASLAL